MNSTLFILRLGLIWRGIDLNRGHDNSFMSIFLLKLILILVRLALQLVLSFYKCKTHLLDQSFF